MEVEYNAWEHDDITVCFLQVQYVFKIGHLQSGGKQIVKEDYQTIYLRVISSKTSNTSGRGKQTRQDRASL